MFLACQWLGPALCFVGAGCRHFCNLSEPARTWNSLSHDSLAQTSNSFDEELLVVGDAHCALEILNYGVDKIGWLLKITGHFRKRAL